MSSSQARHLAVVYLTAAYLLSTASSLAAQEHDQVPSVAWAVASADGLVIPALPALASVPALSAPPPQHRPAALMPLYFLLGAFQGLDAHSTLRALEGGGREANPIVGRVVDSPAGFVALKAGGTAGVIFLTEKLWKRNRTAAILTMIGLNSAYGAVVSHNYAVR
jgi:hypothetical protein